MYAVDTFHAGGGAAGKQSPLRPYVAVVVGGAIVIRFSACCEAVSPIPTRTKGPGHATRAFFRHYSFATHSVVLIGLFVCFGDGRVVTIDLVLFICDFSEIHTTVN